MLRLENIVKAYKVADQEALALKGLSLSFRKNEFVSILGPSGCGKTTTLNIIGGLDKYTSGDLFINGKSTKEFNDRDWDVYRNHRIGFIFQAYNLIPHQTILENVELALTIAGEKKADRVQRCKDALDKVGLKGQYNKKPNQLSGGQCQRVAIARALVNNPEILLADEPTGALDTQTSIQIMELIKEISKERLVIMVTHNPELAEKYSTRIVRLLDGELQSDSNPFTAEEEMEEIKSHSNEEENIKVKENAKMSFWTALKLSARNLVSKLKRTIMVVIAGSIGIIGVSTVLAVSSGVKGYIADMQNDMISGNPVSITESGLDYNKIMNASSSMQQNEAFKNGWEDGKVNVNSMIEYLATHSAIIEDMFINQTISSDYMKYLKDMPLEYYDVMKFDYGVGIDNNVYVDYKVTSDPTNKGIPADKNTKNLSITGIKSMYTNLLSKTDYSEYSYIITSLAKPFMQGLGNKDYVLSQYDVVSGKYPIASNELLLVLDADGTVPDLVLAQMGYYTQEEFFNLIYNSTEEDFDSSTNPYKKNFSYEEIMNKEFRWYSNNDVYKKTGTETMPYSYNAEMNSEAEPKSKMKVVGILKQKDNVNYGSLSSGFYYSEEFVNEVRADSKESEICKYIANKQAETGEDFLTNLAYSFSYYYKGYADSKYNMYLGAGMLGHSDSSMMMAFGNQNPEFKLTNRELGCCDNPSAVYIYPGDFAKKAKVTDYLDNWNKNATVTLSDGTTITHTKEDGTISEMKYTDQIGLIMNMINTMIDIITYALVAFTALSLVVSTVMVGIITYVSVVERVKEIGVIRSLGGRKKDVSHLFNAETFMIGLSSGLFGIIFTALLSLIINLIVRAASDGAVKVIANLTLPTSLIMITLSVILTLISGLIPARSAAHKNPVDALRSE